MPKQTSINKYIIQLVESKQPSYGPIYSLHLVELKILKTYIKTNLVNGFVRPSNSPIDAFIFFVCKPNGSLYLCISYWRFNNLTIKNRYWLPLIGKFLDRLRWIKQFTQLDLTSIYHQMRIKEGNK